MNKMILIIVLCLTVLSCDNKNSEYQKISKFLKSHNFKEPLSNFNTIYVINSGGTCIQCNNDFAKLIKDKLKESKNLFIISQDGTMVDISYYLSQKGKASNIIFDFKNDFAKLKIVMGSTVIKLKDNKIIKKTTINSQNIRKYMVNPKKLKLITSK